MKNGKETEVDVGNFLAWMPIRAYFEGLEIELNNGKRG